MHIEAQDEASARRPSEHAPSRLVKVHLPGLYMLDNGHEFRCIAKEVSLNRLVLESQESIGNGEHCVAYIEQLGRLEGITSSLGARCFVVELNISESRRGKLAAAIEKQQSEGARLPAERRRSPREKPDSPTTTLILEDGRQLPCEVIDLSLVGASVKADTQVRIGEHVCVGKTHGRVTRLHTSGFAMEFDTESEPNAIADHLGQRLSKCS